MCHSFAIASKKRLALNYLPLLQKRYRALRTILSQLSTGTEDSAKVGSPAISVQVSYHDTRPE